MRVFIEVMEAAERLEELIQLAYRGDEILICRGETPIATLMPIVKNTGNLGTENRKSMSAGITSGHSQSAMNTSGPNERR
ncbi:prevent-host-death family protein [Rhizobium halophilum]|uniref:prevent-host-death family protein n=1 Tax=Rhizobium halophilum TaxID=2846852 RepID=UPI001EFC7783|nr:prevent-host-death family protein [Rhizobium halophilum]MCF6371242.1 prevent-host-death family protein [Rhizobium halophilum]